MLAKGYFSGEQSQIESHSARVLREIMKKKLPYVNDLPWKTIGGAIAARMQKPMCSCTKLNPRRYFKHIKSLNNIDDDNDNAVSSTSLHDTKACTTVHMKGDNPSGHI
ncbi:cyclic nucleotide-gated channel 12 [Striga asiatica]|uniref:Cyclic nucleotide-gated channel 12 n=1 Tax=Striga asiatica TaxID=4170 RepID=A0A5A7RGE4_STRAF|nr:cyclic nucleotide-gated channel 12 [Striga asiatica]